MKKLINKIKEEVKNHPVACQITQLLELSYLFYSISLLKEDKELTQKIVKILNEFCANMCKTLEISANELSELAQKEKAKTDLLDKAFKDLNWRLIKNE